MANSNNREYASDVFSMLMEEPEKALDVYNGLNGTNYTNPSMVEICMLERGISLTIRNDAAFIVQSDLNIYEHQSTFNPNMPIRELIYFVEIIKKFIADKDIYGSKKVIIPTPKFVVFYTGQANRPETEILKLSDLYENKIENPALELECICYNITKGKNLEILKKSKILHEYSIFVEKVKEFRKTDSDSWLNEAIEWCINNNVLAEFLTKKKDEVKKVMQLDMTFERREELIRRDAREEGREQGREEGREQGLEDGIKALVKSCKELTGSKEVATNQVMKQYDKSEEEAKEYVENYWE